MARKCIQLGMYPTFINRCSWEPIAFLLPPGAAKARSWHLSSTGGVGPWMPVRLAPSDAMQMLQLWVLFSIDQGPICGLESATPAPLPAS